MSSAHRSPEFPDLGSTKARGPDVLEVGRQRALYLLLFLSGVAGLMYEVVWTRQLTLLFGVSVYAVSTVLAAFMIGMALGSYFFGRLVDERGDPLAVYALLELAVGGYALILPWLFRVAGVFYLSVHSTLPNPGSVLALRFLLAILLLLLPASFLGGTLPAVARLYAGRFGRFGNAVAKLYGVNTLGAVCGAFLAGFVLLQRLGNSGAVAVAVALNLVTGSAALWMWRGRSMAGAVRLSAESRPSFRAVPAVKSVRRAALLAVAISGFTSLGYEVLWTRLLVLRLGNSTWAFSTVLITFLLSLALGSLGAGRWLDKVKSRLALFASLQAGVALSAALSLVAYRRIILLPGSGSQSLALAVAEQFWMAAAVMMPATLLLGAALPLAARIYTERPERAGTHLGATFAANTAGAVLGSIAAGFLLIPAVGIQKGVLLLAFINAGVGVWLFVVAPARRSARLLGLAAASTVAVAVAIAVFSARRPLEQPPPGFQAIFYDEGVAGTVSVFKNPDSGLKILNINHVTEVATDRSSMVTFRLMAYLPYLLHPDPREALVVTFGAGIVTGTLAKLDLDRIDCVEINPDARKIGELFAQENRGATTNSKAHLYIEDGRNFLLTTSRRYDVITSDATHPTGADSWVLYTREYYELCRSRLNRGGLFLQWLPLHALSPNDYRTILATFASVFDDVSLWFTGLQGEVGHTLLIGRKNAAPLDLDRLKQRLKLPVLRTDLEEYGLGSVEELLALYVADRSAVLRISDASPLNTDDRAVTAFPRELPRPGLAVDNLEMIVADRTPPVVTGGDSSERRKVQAAWRASAALLQAQLALRRGDLDRARNQVAVARKTGANNASIAGLMRRIGRRLAQAYLAQADRFSEQGETEPARRAYEAATSVTDDWALPYLKLGAFYRRSGELQQAYTALRRAASLEPSAESWFNLGLVAFQLGKKRQAISHYQEALRYDPQLGIAYTNLGMVYAEMGKWSEAKRAWEKALAVNPGDELARRNLRRLGVRRR